MLVLIQRLSRSLQSLVSRLGTSHASGTRSEVSEDPASAELRESVRVMVDTQRSVFGLIPEIGHPLMLAAKGNVEQSMDLLVRKLDEGVHIVEVSAIARLVMLDVQIAHNTCRMLADGIESVEEQADVPRMDPHDFIERMKENEHMIEESIDDGQVFRDELESYEEWKGLLAGCEVAAEDDASSEAYMHLERELAEATRKLAIEVYNAKRTRSMN